MMMMVKDRPIGGEWVSSLVLSRPQPPVQVEVVKFFCVFRLEHFRRHLQGNSG